MIYEKSGLYIDSDFEIRNIRQENSDIDIIIPLEDKTINLYLQGLPNYLGSRLQFNKVKNIIIRFCTLDDNNVCTIHLLRNIDLQSSIVNFEINYSKHLIELKNREYFVDLLVKNKLMIK